MLSFSFSGKYERPVSFSIHVAGVVRFSRWAEVEKRISDARDAVQSGHETTKLRTVTNSPCANSYIRAPIDLEFTRTYARADTGRCHTRALCSHGCEQSIDTGHSYGISPLMDFTHFSPPTAPRPTSTPPPPHDISNAFKVLFIRSSRVEADDAR